MEKGTKLQLVIADDISWAKEGDELIYLRNSKKYDDDKGIVVVDSQDNTHCIKEYRVAEFGNKSAIARCKANAPKFYVVLQDSCRNFQGERAVVGLEDAETLASNRVVTGEPMTVYELKAISKVSKEPQIAKA